MSKGNARSFPGYRTILIEFPCTAEPLTAIEVGKYSKLCPFGNAAHQSNTFGSLARNANLATQDTDAIKNLKLFKKIEKWGSFPER
mmetsp:Transcript_14534/g.17622  ORF Transcript_14534/g.17622 Transcript_14534/m.17622 type:complete len:86 (+) Transcript_14534:122-379(+)